MKTRMVIFGLLTLSAILFQSTSHASFTPPANYQNNSKKQSFQEQSAQYSTHTNSCKLLLVDDDWDFDQTVPNDGGRPYYTSALDALGYVYEVWDRYSQGDPVATDLQDYTVVIWFTGFAWNNTITGDNETQIATYLDAGGKFVLFSEDYYADRGTVTSFMQTYLGIANITNDKNEIDVIGNATNSIGNNLGPYTLVRPDAWAVYWPPGSYAGPFTDYVNASTDAEEPFKFNSSNENNSTNKEGTGWKTVFLAWPLEWIDSVSDRAEILGNILIWSVPECVPKTNFLPNIINN